MKRNNDNISNSIVQSAIKKISDPRFIKTLPPCFKLSNLFESKRWKNIDPVARRLAGKKFKNYINNQPNIKFVKIDTANHSIYKLI